uniref:Putative replicase n=1 Tax=Degsystermes virus TaxID=2796586 RepID=A0A7T7GUV6_9VIRU|nr:putative replicase [Degsystermes virus]
MEADRHLGIIDFHDPQSHLDFLIQSLYYELDLDIWREPILHVNRDPQTFHTELDVPDFATLVRVEQIEDNVYWSFTVPDHLTDSVSFASSERVTPTRIKYKIRHDFVSETLTTEGTDRLLGDELERLNDMDDNLTPDIFVRDILGTIYIMEIGTSRSTSEESLKRVFREKMFKYEMPIRARRMDQPVVYVVIIVGPRAVISNYNLPQEVVDELTVRMHIGIALEDVAKGKGFSLASEEGETQRTLMMQDILFEISNIEQKDPTPSDKIKITHQYIETILEEPCESAALESFVTSIAQSKEIMTEKKSISSCQLIQEYTENLPPLKKCRSDGKAVVQLPMITLRRSDPSIDVPKIILAPGLKGECLQSLWSSAFMIADKQGNFRPEDKDFLLKEALETNPKKLEQMQKDRKEGRKLWHRVNLKSALNSDTLNYLRRDGLFAKSKKNEEAIKARKMSQKSPFWFETNIQDINDFLEDTKLFEDSLKDSLNGANMIKDLIQKAELMSGNGTTGRNFFLKWSKTNLFESMDIISDIGHEIAISIKQNTKSNEFILKKLRNYDLYLLIKPTNSQSHVFFSIFVPDFAVDKITHAGVFRKLNKLSRGYATDFVSFQISKLQNISNASSTLLTLASFWSDFYGLEDAGPADFMKHKEAQRMLLLSLLVSLEDKAQTEEVITMSRYMYMEVFKGHVNILRPCPFKMLKKFPTCIRSRLTLWFIKSLIRNFSAMEEHPPFRSEADMNVELQEEEDALPGDEWQNLLNCFTGGAIVSASSAVNLMYLGYFKNKNEIAQGNVEWKMVEKILEEEFELDPEQHDYYYGKHEDGRVPKKKQFDRNSVMFGCKLLEARLQNQLGPEWKNVLESEISDALSRHLTHEISTLKASSVCNHEKTNVECNAQCNKKLWRVKVIEAIAAKLGMVGLNPMLKLKSLIEFIETSSNGVICDLFKKNQHGGLREIYVLTIESRIVQLFIETISRTICSHFEEETLTHPSNKLRILDNHKTRSARISRKNNCIYADYGSSSDKTRWNQNFVMTAMAVPLIRLTNPLFHNAIQRILNLWADKLIMLPPIVQKLLMNKIPLSSEVYSELLNKFWGRKGEHKNQLGRRRIKSPYINLTTGMMQGILHYTSSLLHLTFLHSFKYFGLMYLKRKHPNHKFSMAQVCSSDDSATILTVMTEPDKENINSNDVRAFFECDVILEAATIYCNYFCMRESDKSTTSVFDYVEFNSEFIFKNTLAIPMIKFVAACLNLTESESFVNRFYTMYNLISELASSGLPSLNVYYCQIAQLLQHYKSLGLSTNPLFGELFKRISVYPNPVYGFFLVDNYRLAGVLGYAYSRWLAVHNDITYLCRIHNVQHGEVATTPDGGIVSSLCIKHGDLQRWNKMMDRIEVGNLEPRRKTMTKNKATGKLIINKDNIENRKERINKDPELFFRHPDNLPELRTKLMVKASLPGVANSLGKGNPFIQSLALSVYAINTHSFTRTTIKKEYSSEDSTWKLKKKTTKHSLLSALEEYITDNVELVPEEEKRKLLEQMFPLHSRYMQATEIIKSYEGTETLMVHRLRSRKTLLTIQPQVSSVPISLLRICSRWWFNHPIRTSENVYRKCREEYRLAHPWLRETFEETLKASPFEAPVELFNFISTQESRSRKFLLNGPAIRSTKFSSQMSQLIRRNFKRNTLLIRSQFKRTALEKTDKLVTSLSLALLIPAEEKRNSMASICLREIASKYQSIDEVSAISKRDSVLALISLMSEKRLTNLEAVNAVRKLNNGTIVTFTKEQKRTGEGKTTKWTGPGECIASSEGFLFKITMQNDIAEKIVVKEFTTLRRHPGVITDVFNQLKLRAKVGSHYIPRCVAKFNGTSFTSPEGSGTPIQLDKYLEDILSDPPCLTVNISHAKCGIYYKDKKRDLTLCEFRTGYKDINLLTDETPGTEIWVSWIHQRPLRAVKAYAFLNSVSDMMDNPSVSPLAKETHLNWISNTLTSRLKYRRIGYAQEFYTQSILESAEEIDEELDEFAQEFLEQMTSGELSGQLDILFESYKQDLVESATISTLDEEGTEEEEIEKFLGLDFESLLQFESKFTPFRNLLTNYSEERPAHTLSIMRKDVMSYLYLHPLWDLLINDIQVNEFDFFTKTLQGIVSAKNPELSHLIMKIMRIKEKEIELNITQRFRLFAETSIEELD